MEMAATRRRRGGDAAAMRRRRGGDGPEPAVDEEAMRRAEMGLSDQIVKGSKGEDA